MRHVPDFPFVTLASVTQGGVSQMAGKTKVLRFRRFRATRFSRALRVARAELGLTQEEVLDRFPSWAREIIDVTTLSRYERGKFRPEIVVLVAMSDAYDVTVGVLVDRLREDIAEWSATLTPEAA
jgi:hypothetical protein